jgi:hypothetical protein
MRALHFGLGRPVRRTVIQCLKVAQFCLKFHFNTPTRREIAPFLVIEYRCLVWPLLSTESGEERRRELADVGHFLGPLLNSPQHLHARRNIPTRNSSQ